MVGHRWAYAYSISLWQWLSWATRTSRLMVQILNGIPPCNSIWLFPGITIWLTSGGRYWILIMICALKQWSSGWVGDEQKEGERERHGQRWNDMGLIFDMVTNNAYLVAHAYGCQFHIDFNGMIRWISFNDEEFNDVERCYQRTGNAWKLNGKWHV